MMNVSDPTQHFMASGGHKLPAFLSVQFRHVHGHMYCEEISLDRLSNLKNIHHCITKEMKPLADTALRRIQTTKCCVC